MIVGLGISLLYHYTITGLVPGGPVELVSSRLDLHTYTWAVKFHNQLVKYMHGVAKCMYS